MSNLEIIGQRIKHYRKIKSMTQLDLATELGVKPSYLANIEQGNKGISLDRLIKICKFLKISLADIYPMETQDIENDMELKENLIEETAVLLRVLKTSQVKLVKSIVEGITD